MVLGNRMPSQRHANSAASEPSDACSKLAQRRRDSSSEEEERSGSPKRRLLAGVLQDAS